MQFLSNRRLKAEILPRLPITSVLAVNCRWGLCVRNTECAQLPAIEVNTFDRQTCWWTEIATILHAAVYCAKWQPPGYYLAVRSLFDAAYTPEAVLSYQKNNKNKKQLVRRLKLSPPPSQTHTHTSMHATHICSKAYERTLPLTCPASVYLWWAWYWYHLILFHLHQPAPYILLQPLFFSCPCILLLCMIPPVSGIISNKCDMYINQRCQELLHMQRALTLNNK